jgi:very-short-patch-repair endonuclease
VDGDFMSLHYNKRLIPCAKELRRQMTKQEKHLWYDFLVSYPIRFQRQKTIDNFIVDFYCFRAKLIIGIDGSQHYNAVDILNDKQRTEILNTYHLEVLRFSNYDVDRNFTGVCTLIDNKVKERLCKDSI